MGKVLLFTKTKVEPELPWFPTENEIQRYGRDGAYEMRDRWTITRRVDKHTREQVDVLVNVLGLTHLTNLCVDCALAEIIKLCERPDVNAVLNAYAQGKAAAKRKVS
jgi:hypothetical protein